MHLKTLTYLGDSMLLIPTAIIITVLMALKISNLKSSFYWLLTFGTAGLTVSLSKIAFLGFGFGSAYFNFTGFSGHSTMAATLWPVLLWLLSGGIKQIAVRRFIILIGYAVALMVGITRLMLSYHSSSEVISGLILGFMLSSLFLYTQRETTIRAFTASQLAAVLVLPLILISTGRLATTQQFLGKLSAHMAGIDHPWTRTQLLDGLK